MPKRIQLRRVKGYRKPEGAVTVGRGTRWGNPNVMDPSNGGVRDMDGVFHLVPAEDIPVTAVRLYREQLEAGRLPYDIHEVRDELGGKDLACWCPDGFACHADVLLEHANPKPKTAWQGGGSPVFDIQIKPTPDPLVAILESNPCALGHRPAYVVGGGVACGVCGARFT